MNKAWFGLAGGLLLVPVLGFTAALVMTAGLFQQVSAAGECSPSGNTLTVNAVDAKKSGIQMDQDQLSNAATIVSVGRQLNIPASGITVALMVALDESTLMNRANPKVDGTMQLPHQGINTDGTSAGVMSQQNNWGTAANRMNVAWAARAFFGGPTGPNNGSPAGLLDTSNWQSMTPPLAAQAVQVSFDDTGSNYARFEQTAKSLLAYLGTTPDSGGSTCVGQGAAAIGSWKAPNGKTGADLVQYAMQFVGKVPYEMNCGASGNPATGWCCTGFVYYVYNAVFGIQVPGNYVVDQLKNFHQIPQSQARAGDVVAWPNEHVGIYDGNGHVIAAADFGKGTKVDNLPFQIDGINPVYYRANALGGTQ